MNAWRQLLVQPLLRRRAQGRPWVTWVLLAALLLPLAGVLSGWMPRAVAAMLAGALVSGVTLQWWAIFLQTAMRLNTPGAACLVPGMRRRLMTLAAAVWIIASLPPAALFGAASGHFGYAWLSSAATLVFAAIACRDIWVTILPSLSVWLANRAFGDPWMLLYATFRSAGEAVVAPAGMLLVAMLGGLALRRLFPHGGDAHHRFGERLERNLRNPKQGRLVPADGGMSWALGSIYRARLTAGGSAGARLLDALGARAHWSWPVLGIVAIAAATLAWRALGGVASMRPFMHMVLMAMLLMIVMHVEAVLAAVKGSAVEQGILRLVPAAPPPRDLNRQLALALLARFGIAWSAYLACSIVVVASTTGSWGAWVCCTALSLTFAPLLLRDHARHPGWPSVQWMTGGVMLVMLPLGGVVEYGTVATGLVVAFAVILVTGSTVALILRWHHAIAAAPAFPAGRMAG
ncbi:MAG TPA: hypothetical protein VF774_28165 [Pseudoduganella sp.]|jgi:hypothetical protein